MADTIVSVAVAVGEERTLAKIDRSLPLEKIVSELCITHGLPGESYRYALQVTRPSPKTEDPSLINRYVTPDSLDRVLNGTELRLVFSATTTAKLLLETIAEESGPRRRSALAKLAGACEDFEFARCFVAVRGPDLMVDGLRTAEAIEASNALACLRLSMQHGHLRKIGLPGLDRIIAEIIGPGNDNALREALLTGCLILANASSDDVHATHLRQALTTVDTLNLIVGRSSAIQLAVLGMVNALLLSSDAERRERDLEALSAPKSRRLIFRHVLGSGQKQVNQDLAHQLHVLQTLLLNYMLGESERIFAFDTENVKLVESRWSRSTSVETLLDKQGSSVGSPALSRSASRITLDISEPTHYMPSTPTPSPRPAPTLRKQFSVFSSFGDTLAGCLAFGCLEYFAKHYRDSFVLVKEEADMIFGMSRMAQDVVEVLCEVLHVGTRHDSSSDRFSPIFFAARDSFFEELFCLAMWTLGRTGRDIRAREPEDRTVVLLVLRRQLEDALTTRPTTLNALTDCLKDITAAKVQDVWKTEQQAKFELILHKHPAVLELRRRIRPEAKRLVTLQRLNALKIGHAFSKQMDTLKTQKAKNWWFAHVSEDERVIIYGDWNLEVRSYASLQKRISVASATGLATGKRCPHAKGRKFMGDGLFFSLLHEGGSLDFIAPNKEIYNLWTDGLTFLLGRSVESAAFKENVEMMVDMEVRLKLLELGDGGTPVPFEAPPVPPAPENYDFASDTNA